ncbi:SulP family inorganic anion transporter [Microvirga sp. STS02]|uniref:SulP family inorganic anion transporter n=1 Tax=Hymenobacter negativus TaxID=2795026 RepID=UPI0018DB4009|nr:MULTISPECIES: SulP family inorganic anion transporter [Bacteria]MBH8571143.1 SulP family inorganic anion transporter [Hymenobacter negativus]MBR7210880.1 SulP family inorganic anion transporter [Microvirga sp. STS02]
MTQVISSPARTGSPIVPPVAPANPRPKASLFSTIGQDAPAGLVVFLVALPLCLGISLASGAPLLAGVIAGIVGGVLVSVLSGSAVSVSGPAAGLTVVMLSAIATLGSWPAVLAATVVAGVIQIILGLARAGIIALYFPAAVIRGMLAAIGIILILKQLPHFFGADADYFEDMNFLQFNGMNTFSAIGAAMKGLSPGSVLVGVVSLVILLLWNTAPVKRQSWSRLVPGALIAVLASVAINFLLKKVAPELQVRPEHLVKLPVVTSLGQLASEMTFPDFEALRRPATYGVAFTIAIVASLETLLSVEAVDNLDPQKRHTPTNRELMAQGAGNLVSGLLGGLPLTAVIVRSSANIAAGAQSKMSAFIHGLLLLTSLLFLGAVLNLIPLSALAAVLLTVGFKLTTPALYRKQWQLGWAQFMPFIITIVAVLFTDLLKGVSIGLVLGFFFILKDNARAGSYLRRDDSEDNAKNPAAPLHLRLPEHVSFLNKASIVTTLDQLPADSRVILDGTRSDVIDHDVLEAIEAFRQAAPARGIKLELRGIRQVALGAH